MKNKTIPKQVPFVNNEKWYNKLPLDKQLYIANMVKRKLDKIHADTTEILDSCFIGAMIEEKEMSLDDCIQIAKKANINMHDTMKILDSEGERYYMRVNNNELRTEIRLEAKAMLVSNPKASTLDISRELQKNYELPVKDLHIIVAEARKELKAEQKEQFCNEVGQENEKALNKEVAADEENKIAISVKEAIETLEVEQAVFKNHNKPKLKVKNVIQEVEGEFGVYIKSIEGVKTGDKVYKDITDVKHEIEVLESGTKATEDNINKEIEKLIKQKEELHNYKKQEFEKYAELEEVFSL